MDLMLLEWTRQEVRMIPKVVNPADCRSTHGAAGYCMGSYWDGEVIVCGACGTRIQNPRPVGQRWVRSPGWRGWFGHGVWEPCWPDFIAGKRGKRRLECFAVNAVGG